MKTYLRRFDITLETVEAAYDLWCKSQAGRLNSWRVAKEHGSAENLIEDVYEEIKGRSLTCAPVRFSDITDPNSGKLRRIGVESVKQQLVDYVAVSCLQPLIDARTGYWQVASVKGKGGAYVATALRKWTRERGWFAHLDIRKCYPSIKPDVVHGILAKRVASEDVMYVCDYLLSTYEDGLSIGSYYSLRMCQLVLSEGYHHVEGLRAVHHGRERALVRHQLWYMDDVVLFCRSKRDLRRACESLSAFMASLGLEVKPYKVCRLRREWVQLGGWRARSGVLGIRGRIFRRARRAFLRLGRAPCIQRAKRAASYWGWLKRCGRGIRARYAPTLRMAGAMVSKEALA